MRAFRLRHRGSARPALVLLGGKHLEGLGHCIVGYPEAGKSPGGSPLVCQDIQRPSSQWKSELELLIGTGQVPFLPLLEADLGFAWWIYRSLCLSGRRRRRRRQTGSRVVAHLSELSLVVAASCLSIFCLRQGLLPPCSRPHLRFLTRPGVWPSLTLMTVRPAEDFFVFQYPPSEPKARRSAAWSEIVASSNQLDAARATAFAALPTTDLVRLSMQCAPVLADRLA